jgi:hypothetical protein
MTLKDFIDQIRAGEVIVPGGFVRDNTFGSVIAPLTLDNPRAVTNEAFAHDVFDPKRITWDEAFDLVEAEIG